MKDFLDIRIKVQRHVLLYPVYVLLMCTCDQKEIKLVAKLQLGAT